MLKVSRVTVWPPVLTAMQYKPAEETNPVVLYRNDKKAVCISVFPYNMNCAALVTKLLRLYFVSYSHQKLLLSDQMYIILVSLSHNELKTEQSGQ